MKKDFIIIIKDISAKENRKTILKVTRDFFLLLLAFYVFIFAFIKILYWIWI
jgi:hypothetical protein